MMSKLRSELNVALKFYRQYRPLVCIILLLGHGSSRHHVSADTGDGDVRSTQEHSNTSLPSSESTPKSSSVAELSSVKTRKEGGITREPKPTTPKVVSFVIDGTIGCEEFEFEVQKNHSYVTDHPECPHFSSSIEHPTLGTEQTLIVFLPHLRILFDYLLMQGVRISFYTTGAFTTLNTDASIIEKLLESLWDGEKYKELKSQGQFRHDVGDAKDILRVDRNPLRRYRPQQPFILVRAFYPGTDRDGTRLNSVYYMLGLFKTYFENAKYREMSMGEAFTQILPDKFGVDDSLPENCVRFDHEHPFVHEMINVGLSAVREEVPNATLYQRFGPRFEWHHA